jgi:hypothetical protein
MMMEEYECSVAGTTAPAAQYNESDGQGDLPVGWTRVTITRRQYNPKWVMIQQTKQSMIEGLIHQLGEDLPQFQQYALSLQVEAQFHGLESETPMYLPDVEEVVHLSGSDEILDSVNEMRELIGLEPLLPTEEEAEEMTEDTPALPTEEAQNEQIEVAV